MKQLHNLIVGYYAVMPFFHYFMSMCAAFIDRPHFERTILYLNFVSLFYEHVCWVTGSWYLRILATGPVWDSVREAYLRKMRNKPVKRRAFDACFPAARSHFKRKLNCATQNRRSGPRWLIATALFSPAPPNRAIVECTYLLKKTIDLESSLPKVNR